MLCIVIFVILSNVKRKNNRVLNMKNPIRKNVQALPHTPQYKMHKYFARRPYNVFSNLVEYYTDPGQIILDIFCGGGVTVFEGCKLARNVIGVDLNPLATFVTKMQMFNGDLKALESAITSFIEKSVEPLNSAYNIDIKDRTVKAKWLEWAYVVSCPICHSDIVLSEENKVKNGVYKCPNTKCKCSKGVARTQCISKSALPLRMKILGETSSQQQIHFFSSKESKGILNTEKKFKKELPSLEYPSFEFPMDWDRQKEDKLLEKGVARYGDLFSNRNLTLLSKIFKDIKAEKKKGNKYADYLYFIFSSTLRYTNKMSKVTENWEGGNPICMDKHAYYLPNSFIENNVVEVFKDRAHTILKGCAFSCATLPSKCHEVSSFDFRKNSANYWVINGSSDDLPLKDESVDVVITDPPYGSNVQYAELSVVWNAWFQLYANKSQYIYREKEAVSNRKRNFKGAKDESDYERILKGIFSEAYRVLKPNSYMVFTFNNKNLNVWLAMLRAVAKSGFSLPENGVLFQDFISSYKNTSHLKYAGNVQGDFIYSFVKTSKCRIESMEGMSIEQIIDASISKVIDKVLKNSKANISSEELYKHLFSILAKNIMQLITYKQSINEDVEFLDFEEKSIDRHLEKRLRYHDGYWYLKKGSCHD